MSEETPPLEEETATPEELEQFAAIAELEEAGKDPISNNDILTGGE